MKRIDPQNYIHSEICEGAINDDALFNIFKQNRTYNQILEHTTAQWANIYISLMIQEYGEIIKKLDWDKLKENDIYGSPNIVSFPKLKSHLNIQNDRFSPSTIYYIYRGLHIIDKLLKSQVKLNILEIGGGYGGQCKLLFDLCEMLNIVIESYGIIDLEYASKLQHKYLNKFNYSNIDFYEFETLTDFEQFKKYDTLISIYALGEFVKETQEFYVDNITKYFDSYYFIWNGNYIHPYYDTMSYPDEVPKTGPFNKFIIKNK